MQDLGKAARSTIIGDCWFCKEFWTNRLAATEPPLEISQTRIPEIPDQKEFLDRWFEFHQGYRIATRPDGTEQRIAVIGEPLHEVSPGFLPRTLDQLRAGVENDARRPENRLRRRRLTSEDERPAEPQQSLEDALDSLLEADSENETPADTSPTTLNRPTSNDPETPQQPPIPMGPFSQAASRRQRAQERFARVFGTVEDVQQDDYESPLSNMYNRAWNRYRQAEDLRATDNTEAPPLEGLSAQERQEIEDQLLWGVMRESQLGTEPESNVWSYTPVRNEPGADTRSGHVTITPPWANLPATSAPPSEPIATTSSSAGGMSEVRLSLEQITSELQLRGIFEFIHSPVKVTKYARSGRALVAVYGGLGNIDIPLLSDATHKIGKDYGVLVEEEGISLRGMFIIDGEGLVQQITLNNLTVGRSVLEALRLLEALQAVAKHGVLCPIDWKPNSHASDTMNTISNTLVESYEDRLANLQKEFGDVQITDLDAKHRAPISTDDIPHAEFVQTPRPKVNITPAESSNGAIQASSDARDPPSSPGHSNCVPRVDTEAPREQPVRSNSDQGKLSHLPSPITAVATPVSTRSAQDSPPMKLHSQERTTARHSRGHHSAHHTQQAHSAPPKRSTHLGSRPLTYESEGGSHITLEFADPTASPIVSPSIEYKTTRPPTVRHTATSPAPRVPALNRRSAPVVGRATSWSGVLKRENNSAGTPARTPTVASGITATGQTRLQATFQAIKKMSAGLSSPRFDYSPSKQSAGERSPGYFDVTTEEPEES
ncbi:hypothetical protein E8E11_010390 [Didymella keratinophila]|nr:hypothetical protein E8E11_010390 [Didymella keratinophila]